MIYTKDNPRLVKYYYDFEGRESFTGVVKDNYGIIVHYVNGKYHRPNGPALTYPNSDTQWYLNGKLHREDGPAVEFRNDKGWYLCGKNYGWDRDYTIESWIRFVKLYFLK